MSPRIGLDTETLLQAATELVDTHGYEQLSLAELAKKLTIKTPSLYNHINGLPDLRAKLALRGLQLLYEYMEQSIQGLAEREAVQALAQAYLLFARNHPGLYEATIQAPAAEQTELQEAAGQVVSLAAHVMMQFGLQHNQAMHAVRGFRSIVHGFSSLERKSGFGMPLDLDQSFSALIHSFLAGIEHYKTLQE